MKQVRLTGISKKDRARVSQWDAIWNVDRSLSLSEYSNLQEVSMTLIDVIKTEHLVRQLAEIEQQIPRGR